MTKNSQLLTWYMCGPTVYDHSHIGHAWCYVNFDIIRRIMENHFNLSVFQVMNITDIDDKIIHKAKEENVTVREIAETYELDFLDDMFHLGVQPPSLLTRVTDFIPEIVSFIEKIIEKGFAYPVPDGSVYFDLDNYSKEYVYGKLKPVSRNDIEVDAIGKKSSNDFALWKGKKIVDEPSWEAPWGGEGRPGWHIECSAMASHTIGSWIDVHTGGIDLAFPHHENEEAQCCAYHDVGQWVGHWMHASHLRLGGSQKMSKSLKNTVSIKEFLESYSADDFRMLCLLSNYRTEMDYSEKSLEMASDIIRSVRNFETECQVLIRNRSIPADIDSTRLLQVLDTTKGRVRVHLGTDFNTAQATVCVRQLISTTYHEIRRCGAGGQQSCRTGRSSGMEAVAAVSHFVSSYFASLGFNFNKSRNSSDQSGVQWKAILDDVIGFRSTVRRFALASDHPGLTKEEKRRLLNERRPLIDACDTIRDQLKTKGIQLKDQPTATTWTYNKF